MLNVYTLDQGSQWDAIVRLFANYDVYWLSGYVKAFCLHGDGEPLLFYYEDKQCKGINVVMKRDISEDLHFIGKVSRNNFFDFATPYGYGGWLIQGEDREGLFRTYEMWCKENGIICEFVRFHPVIKNHTLLEENYDIVPLGQTIALDISSPEVIWANLTSKNRNKIRKAEKAAVKIYNGRSEELYKEFKEIYNLTMDLDNAQKYYYFTDNFYKSVCYDLPENAQIFYAVKEGEIIAASIMITANGYLSYHLSGSKSEYRGFAPSNLLLYKAALWGYANGCKTFHLGGGVASSEDSLFKFKRSFYRGDELCRYYIGKKIYIQEKYDKLVGLREENGSEYFPKYRA